MEVAGHDLEVVAVVLHGITKAMDAPRHVAGQLPEGLPHYRDKDHVIDMAHKNAVDPSVSEDGWAGPWSLAIEVAGRALC